MIYPLLSVLLFVLYLYNNFKYFIFIKETLDDKTIRSGYYMELKTINVLGLIVYATLKNLLRVEIATVVVLLIVNIVLSIKFFNVSKIERKKDKERK